MAVRDAGSASSHGELAPAKNTFVQPGTYKDNPDTAMTDGIKHAMLKEQHAKHAALTSSWQVRKHLRQHHGIQESETPLTHHAQAHTLAQLTQGHSMNADGDLFHGTTDIDPGTANFAYEAPPLVGSVIELRTVRREAPLRSEISLAHQQLLTARKDARAKYPVGHPERLAAERAVRKSRKDSRVAQAHISDSVKAADARTDPGFYSPKETVIAGGAPTGGHATGVGGVISPKLPEVRRPIPSRDQVSQRLGELAKLTDPERNRYFAMRNAGALHDNAMTNIKRARSQATAARTVVKIASRKRKLKGA